MPPCYCSNCKKTFSSFSYFQKHFEAPANKECFLALVARNEAEYGLSRHNKHSRAFKTKGKDQFLNELESVLAAETEDSTSATRLHGGKLSEQLGCSPLDFEDEKLTPTSKRIRVGHDPGVQKQLDGSLMVFFPEEPKQIVIPEGVCIFDSTECNLGSTECNMELTECTVLLEQCTTGPATTQNDDNVLADDGQEEQDEQDQQQQEEEFEEEQVELPPPPIPPIPPMPPLQPANVPDSQPMLIFRECVERAHSDLAQLTPVHQT